MNLGKTTEIANELLAKYRLDGWSFKINKNKRRLGVCKEYAKCIELSEHFILRNPDELIMDTILHEIAHALVGTDHGHNTVWKEMCLKIGCKPKACEDEVLMPEGDWQAQCPGCRSVISRHRKPRPLRGLYCLACGPEQGSLTFKNSRIIYKKRIDKFSQNKAVQLMLKIF